MLSPDVQKKIVRLFRHGYCEAEICRATGVSRTGVRRLMAIARRHVPIEKRLARIIQAPVTQESVFGRCPTCGAKCYLPCKACLTKQYNQLCAQPVKDESYTESEVIDMLQNLAKEKQDKGSRINTLNLRPAERKRYEEVRRRKEAEMERRSAEQVHQLEFV